MINSAICSTKQLLILTKKKEKVSQSVHNLLKMSHFDYTSKCKRVKNEKPIRKRKILGILPVFQPCLGLHSQGLIYDLCPPKKKST